MNEISSLVGNMMLIGITLLSIFSVLCMVTSSAGGNSTKEVFSTTIRVDISRKVLVIVLFMLTAMLVAEIFYCVIMSVFGR